MQFSLTKTINSLSSSLIKDLLKALIFLSIGCIVMFLVYRSNQAAFLEDCNLKGIAEADCSLIQKVINDFSTVKIPWIILVILLFVLSNWSRARRWHLMLNPIGYHPRMVNSFLGIMLAYFTNLGIPRSGEFIRAGTLAKYENIPFEKLMGTIIVDRIVDVLCLLVAIALTFFFEYERFYNYLLENNVIGEKAAIFNAGNLLWIALAGIIFLGLMWVGRKLLQRTKFYDKLRGIIKGFVQGIMSIRSLERPWEFVFHSIFIWFLYFLMIYLCFFAYDPTAHLGLGAGLVTFVFGALGIVFPSPGGMGSYHYMVGESLSLFGINASDGFTFAMVAFVAIQIFCNVFFGIVALIGLPLLNKSDSINEQSEN